MHLRYLLICFSLSLFSFSSAEAAVVVVAPEAAQQTMTSSEVLARKAVEARLGRKLTFRERIGLGIVRAKAKRQQRRAARGKAVANGGKLDSISLIAGILGILTIPALFLGLLGGVFALGALIMGIIGLTRTPRDGFRSGKGWAIVGTVIGGLYFLLVLVAIAILALAFSD